MKVILLLKSINQSLCATPTVPQRYVTGRSCIDCYWLIPAIDENCGSHKAVNPIEPVTTVQKQYYFHLFYRKLYALGSYDVIAPFWYAPTIDCFTVDIILIHEDCKPGATFLTRLETACVIFNRLSKFLSAHRPKIYVVLRVRDL